jgi:putative transcriptional regulator
MQEDTVIRFHLKRLISDWEFREGRRLSIGELAEKSLVTRPTLSRILNQKGFNTTTENLGRLCAFFNCRIEDLVEYVADDEASPQ